MMEPQGDGGRISYGAIQRIANAKCGGQGCHRPPDIDMYFSVGTMTAMCNMGERRFVVPDDPDSSYLIRKLQGGPMICNNRMPLGRAPLPPEEIDLIREWIRQGARRD
ncbi:MAG: hypothetical protein N2515_02125 [Deltaproteobacteria bacterium]|nr:hypothetical protein [Sandaracinaceae bacterium]MCX7807381.1 hypothetical protein [Deltaproteobacteria bacterium]MDW8247228.1 hypothetical protein [Sandaracinaceae bacterium]